MLKLLTLLLLQLQPQPYTPVSVSVLRVNDTSLVNCLAVHSVLIGCVIMEGHTLDEVMTLVMASLYDSTDGRPLPGILMEMRTAPRVLQPIADPVIDPDPVTDGSLLSPVAPQP